MPAVTRPAFLIAALLAPLMTEAQATPSPDQIIARHVTAIGGTDAVMRIRSIRNSGKLEVPSAGISANIETVSAANRSSVRMNVPGIGEIRNGYDGTIAWEVNPMTGPRIKPDKEKIAAQEDADFQGSMLFAKERFQSVETVGAADFAGEKTWQLKTVLKSGKVVNEYFSVATGLRVGSTSAQESLAGPVNVIILESDYKQFGAVKLATRNEMTTGAQRVVVTLTEVVLDDLPANAFALPEAIKALLTRQ